MLKIHVRNMAGHLKVLMLEEFATNHRHHREIATLELRLEPMLHSSVAVIQICGWFRSQFRPQVSNTKKANVNRRESTEKYRAFAMPHALDTCTYLELQETAKES